jgi:hypothetical protein
MEQPGLRHFLVPPALEPRGVLEHPQLNHRPTIRLLPQRIPPGTERLQPPPMMIPMQTGRTSLNSAKWT